MNEGNHIFETDNPEWIMIRVDKYEELERQLQCLSAENEELKQVIFKLNNGKKDNP